MELLKLDQGVQRLCLAERFAFPECLRVHEEARAVLSRGDKLLIDFSACTHIDSSALGVLFSLRRALSADSQQLALVNINPQILSILRSYKLHQFFDLAE